MQSVMFVDRLRIQVWDSGRGPIVNPTTFAGLPFKSGIIKRLQAEARENLNRFWFSQQVLPRRGLLLLVDSVALRDLKPCPYHPDPDL
jgi:hypothetical protein